VLYSKVFPIEFNASGIVIYLPWHRLKPMGVIMILVLSSQNNKEFVKNDVRKWHFIFADTKKL